MSTAIIIFAFNRPSHLKATVEHLEQNPEFVSLPVFVFVDGPRHDSDISAVKEVVSIANQIRVPNLHVLERPHNLGLKKSVISGITQVFEQFDQAIVLEDDICVSPHFLNFHLNGLNALAHRTDIWSISGFVIPEIGQKCQQITGANAVLAKRASSWGWSTWKSKWLMANFDSNFILQHLKSNHKAYGKTGGDKLRMLVRELSGKSSSWAIIWDYNHFIHQAFCLYPLRSFIRNIGLDNSGTHSKPLKAYEVENLNSESISFDPNIQVDARVLDVFAKINYKPYRWPLDYMRLLRVIKG